MIVPFRIEPLLSGLAPADEVVDVPDEAQFVQFAYGAAAAGRVDIFQGTDTTGRPVVARLTVGTAQDYSVSPVLPLPKSTGRKLFFDFTAGGASYHISIIYLRREK